MLKIVIPGEEYFDENTSEFSTTIDITLEFEHSLFSLSKWEQKFEKVFLTSNELTPEESMAYVEAMIITPDFPPGILDKLSVEQITEIHDYIGRKMTATTFRDNRPPGQKRVITNELLYFWMTAAGIPFECQYWHLNRLITLLRIYDIENNTKKQKVNAKDAAAQRRALNEQRRAQLGTKG